MASSEELRELLNRIDRKGYPAYKDTRGKYVFSGYQLSIDHVQGDPFASPSKVSVHITGGQAGFPKELYDTQWRRITLQDYLLRLFYGKLKNLSFQAKGSGKSGLLSVSRCGQEILERSACQVDAQDGGIVLRLEVGFPANGRTVNSRELIKIFFEYLPNCVKDTLYWKALDKIQVQKAIDLSDDRQVMKEQLKAQGLVAFVADGSILPRESGVSGKPMKGAVKFKSPKELLVSMELPHVGKITGMGIKKGITLIVGGGYHGKSTLLKALELGVYPHIAGDGREYVITEDSAVKIRAEDGRSIQKTDISMFINNLPNGKDTASFSTEDASGSTSQAANVIEAIEGGTKTFLIDEDTSATNFMIRDELMQRVVHQDAEPITPFIDRIQECYSTFGISTILVAGSSGSYFHKADCIVQMNQYTPYEITDMAKQEALLYPIPKQPIQKAKLPEFSRYVQKKKTDPSGRVKVKTLGLDSITIDREVIDVRYVEQLVDTEQLSALGYMIVYANKHVFDSKLALSDGVEELFTLVCKKGLGAICEGSYLPCNLAMPRKQEFFAAINRYREIIIR